MYVIVQHPVNAYSDVSNEGIVGRGPSGYCQLAARIVCTSCTVNRWLDPTHLSPSAQLTSRLHAFATNYHE